MTSSHLREVDIMSLDSHETNVRIELTDLEELTASIKEYGVLQPLLVQSDGPDKYKVLAGHRRHRAAQNAGLKTVPVKVIAGRAPMDQVLIMVTENIQRVNLNPMEISDALEAMHGPPFNFTQEKIAEKMGKSVFWATMYLSFQTLSEPMKRRLRNGEVTANEAYRVVKENRRDDRKGKHVGAVWEPPHFDKSHGLARKVKQMCDGLEHSLRRRVGGVGCGQCWERAIRSDEARRVQLEIELEAKDNNAAVRLEDYDDAEEAR